MKIRLCARATTENETKTHIFYYFMTRTRTRDARNVVNRSLAFVIAHSKLNTIKYFRTNGKVLNDDK